MNGGGHNTGSRKWMLSTCGDDDARMLEFSTDESEENTQLAAEFQIL